MNCTSYEMEKRRRRREERKEEKEKEVEVEPLKKRWRRLVFSFNASLRRRSIGIITELSRTHGVRRGR